MADRIRWGLVVCLAVVYIATLTAVLHPHVSAAYKAFLIDRTSTDLYVSYYPGTPEEGIVFSRPGLPHWVTTTFGLSYREAVGRWTDDNLGNHAGLVFQQPFNGSYCVQFTARPSPRLGNSFRLRFGAGAQTIEVKSTASSEYRVPFPDVHSADKLEFILPKDLPRASALFPKDLDERRAGLLLAELKILPGACQSAARP